MPALFPAHKWRGFDAPYSYLRVVGIVSDRVLSVGADDMHIVPALFHSARQVGEKLTGSSRIGPKKLIDEQDSHDVI